MYCGYITTLKNVRPHSNAERMKLADCFGNTICVGIDAAEGEIGVYKNHIPTTVIIKPGVLTITSEEEKKIAALHSGFATILQDKITILAEIIMAYVSMAAVWI